MPMTHEAKAELSRTIRGLRQRLLDDLHAATEGVYRLSAPVEQADLGEAARVKRERLTGWIDEQVRTVAPRKREAAQERFRQDVEKEAAYTLLNRLVYLRLLEAARLTRLEVVTGGWESKGYREFREWAPALCDDETDGYALLLSLAFGELAQDLPGLYGDVGLTSLVPVPPALLRAAVEALDQPELESCWTDDMTLGWIYQYWNDPEREALDAKLNSGGKVEPHEIASKTQMFTERYMVDWLLQNSLGPMWLAMCRKQGWTPEVEADGTLGGLEQRRVEWRGKRERGEVELTELMPLYTEAERRWAYYVPQPIPDDAVVHAPESVRELKILDPAVGSGHFLVVAFDLLVALYREEAWHRGEVGDERWSDRAVVECILEHNLHGIDLDPRAVQIAAAALWLKAKTVSPAAKPPQLNLVAANLRLSSLPDDDPALIELRREVKRETGIPAALTDTLINALKGADHLGSLLKIDSTVDKALQEMEGQLGKAKPVQGDLMTGFPAEQQRLTMSAGAAKESLLAQLESFLSRHTSGDDLGLRLRGEQLAAGVRFVRLVREGTYDLVVANPPYQGTSKMADSKYIETQYPLGKADLYAAFLLRGLQLVREGGVSAMLTMRNWMFIKQYSGLRESLLRSHDLRALGDFDRGAFEDVPDEVVSVAVSAFCKASHHGSSMALCPTPREDRTRDSERTHRKRAATLCHVGRHEFDPAALKVVPEWPLVYWWGGEFIDWYKNTPKLEDISPAKPGMCTGDNSQFILFVWEVIFGIQESNKQSNWYPFIKGAEGKKWKEPLSYVLRHRSLYLQVRVKNEAQYGSYTRNVKNEQLFYRQGVACATVGNSFSARHFGFEAIFADVSRAVMEPPAVEEILCSLNSRRSQDIICSLNPSISFSAGDINRTPICAREGDADIVAVIDAAFSDHESHSEPSVEFLLPGPSPWRQAQDWAQLSVDRPEGDPLPAYVEELDPEPPTDHLSFSLGVALGRFGPNNEGVLDPTRDDLSHAVPNGILFLDGSLNSDSHRDSLGRPAAIPLHDAWTAHGYVIDPKADLRTYLRMKFFSDTHRKMYENRPIHWPLSSQKKTFVAWITIHRWTADTLRALLADHLHPTRVRLEGELDDLRAVRDSTDRKAVQAAERHFTDVQRWLEELNTFIHDVEQCAEHGPPSTDSKCPERECDARYDPDLDDGVMINSAALWPLLLPQWKDPKKWWKELATAKGRKDYDWSHLAARYFPTRVDAKSQQAPSLAVAHGCFWRYHTEKAYAWELRLQDEIAPDFTIDEADSDEVRAALLHDYPDLAAEIRQTEMTRRERKARKEAREDGAAGPLFEQARASGGDE